MVKEFKVYIYLCDLLLLQDDRKSSSVDPVEAGEPMEVQGLAQSSDADRKSQEDSQESNKSIPPPNRWWTSLRQMHKRALVTVFLYLSSMFFSSPFRPINNKDQKNDRNNSKNKGDAAKTKQPSLDQNVDMEPNAEQTRQTKHKGENEQGKQQMETPAAKQKMVFGSPKPSEVILTKMY